MKSFFSSVFSSATTGGNEDVVSKIKTGNDNCSNDDNDADDDANDDEKEDGLDLSELAMFLDTIEVTEPNEEELERSAKAVSSKISSLKQDQQLILYGLYKQSTLGNINQPNRPSFIEMVKRAKWDAWKSFEGFPQSSAKKLYVYLSNEIINGDGFINKLGDNGDNGSGSSIGSFKGAMSREIPSNAENKGWSDSLKIFQAVVDGDIDKVKEFLLDPNNDINCKDDEGMSLLHFAVDRGYLAMTQLLLDHRADTHILDAEGQTPLQYAIDCNHLDIIKLLST